MAVQGVNHVTMACADVGRGVAFYVDVLGCRLLARWPHGAYLLAGELWVALVEGADEVRGPDDYSHVALHADAAGLAAIDRRAAAAGVERWQENWTEGDSLYLLDPAGHRLEIHATSLADRLRHASEQPWDGLVIEPGAIEAAADVTRRRRPPGGRSRAGRR